MRRLACALVLLAAACSSPAADEAGTTAGENAVTTSELGNTVNELIEIPGPGEPGGLSDDGTPLTEEPAEPGSGQAAATIVETYFGLLESKKYAEAYGLWSDNGAASGMSQRSFADGFGRYGEYHAQVGAPGRVEGAAGSLFVSVPVQVYGRLAGGQPFNERGTVTLRRVNDVPGSTEEQRRWRIVTIELTEA